MRAGIVVLLGLLGVQGAGAQESRSLSGRWSLSNIWSGYIPVLFTHKDTKLEAVVTREIRCLNQSVKMELTFAGEVRGDTVTLRDTDGRLSGGGGSWGTKCDQYAEYVPGSFDFSGMISPDGKKVVGSVKDRLGKSTKWTFTR
jgi:hypothetical protein